MQPSIPKAGQHQTLQPGVGRGRGRGRGRGATRAGGGNENSKRMEPQRNGTYHCEYFIKSKKCDVCQHMVESNHVYSHHYKVKHSIAGNNVHLKATENLKLCWFIYLKECIHPEGNYQYVGSTNSVTERWANTKSKCLARNKEGTGLEKHYKEGCSAL